MKKLLDIQIDEIGTFLERPNRFISHIRLDSGEEIIAHVHDTGRLTELLIPGSKVMMRRAKMDGKRKTQWDLIASITEDDQCVLINASFQRRIADKILNDESISPFGKCEKVKAEVKYGKSRLDYLIEKDNKNIWLESKGVSLSRNRRATFPASPSTRACKHLQELMCIKENGERAGVILLIFRESDIFEPMWEVDKKFSKLFYEAMDKGIEIYPIQIVLNKKGELFYSDKKILTEENKGDTK